ncbi:MAG: CDP-alcohol phosphatidyltransferase family protein [Woeseiaceae bacterium]|nr:CDP-alcohol phosphatidyltransferase family protein [Woeseiaceae bacterium]
MPQMPLSWIPNAITLFRIVLIVPSLMLILKGSFGWAMVLFWVAGFSDGVDGYLAKRFDWGSRMGALLDPVADKLLVVGLFAILAYLQHIPVWLAVLVILRDVVIVVGAAAYNFLVRPIEGEPTRVSKLNMALQLLFLMIVMSRAGFGWPDEIAVTVLGASILITVVISGVDYVWSWSHRARKGE